MSAKPTSEEPEPPSRPAGRPGSRRAQSRPLASGGSHRPWVFVNMAMTADGKIATANRKVSSFGSPEDQENLYRLRSTADAILCGARTVDLESVDLDAGEPRFRKARMRRGLAEQPLRVVVSGRGTVDPEARVFRNPISPVLVLTSGAASARRIARLGKLASGVHVSRGGPVDFEAALAWLWTVWGVRRLLCEGGGELNQALFRGGWVDELHLTVCPVIAGGAAAPTLAGGLGVESLVSAAGFGLVRSRFRPGGEAFLTYRRLVQNAS